MNVIQGTGLRTGPSFSTWLGWSKKTMLWADDGFGNLVLVRDRRTAYNSMLPYGHVPCAS